MSVRTICGDSLEVLRRLPNDAFSALVTDPPANLGFMGKAWDKFAGDENGQFGYYLSGLTDGEGCFRIHREKAGDYYACHFSIKLRRDDLAILEQVRKFVGFGRINLIEANTYGGRQTRPGAQFTVDTREGCIRIRDIFRRYELRAKKRRDFALWSEALQSWINQGRGNRWAGPSDKSRMRDAWLRMKEIREYREPPKYSGNAFKDFLLDIFTECFRVLRPGAHGAIWAIPKTSHWTALALEDAGFEIRDRVHHVFGSGMPHSKDASKAIDLFFDVPLSLRPVIGRYTAGGNAGTSTAEKGGTFAVGAPTSGAIELTRTTGATPEAQRWDGWQTALKPGCEDWWIVRKPLEGTLAENLLKHGCGALNIDACRVVRNWDERGEAWKRSGVSAQPDAEKIAAPPGQGMILHPGGGWPANLVFTHSFDCTIEECASDCPAGQVDAQTGLKQGYEPYSYSSSSSGYGGGKFGEASRVVPGIAAGGGSRYFNVFYRPKATRAEREAGLAEAGLPVRTGGEATGRKDGSAGVANPHAGAGRGGGRRNDHPTVKDVGTKDEPGLMRWLCRLVTPPGGIVLDPFAGSGSTGVACMLDGFDCLQIDSDPHYCEIAMARAAYWEQRK